MKFIPPSPSRIPEAVRFVKDISRLLGVTDFQAVVNAGVGQLAGSLMFFSWMFSSIYKFTTSSTLLAVFSGALALLCVISGIRTLNLLYLFLNTDLPESLLEEGRSENECSFGTLYGDRLERLGDEEREALHIREIRIDDFLSGVIDVERKPTGERRYVRLYLSEVQR